MVNRKLQNKCLSDGSALILAVVLTSMLALIGILFVMAGRIENTASSAVSENKDLDLALDSVVAQIKDILAADVPGVNKPDMPASEYYDYPGLNDPWLASLEPFDGGGGNYYWRQITDMYGLLGNNREDVPAILVSDSASAAPGLTADADGDGVTDSRWVRLADVTSSKGREIFAAVRIIDNGGMLNVNTAYKFDPSLGPSYVDGSSQMQINLAALSYRGSNPNPLVTLNDVRFGSEPHNLDNYLRDVVWRYDSPSGNYTPFDISDELELRNRFLLNNQDIDVRLETFWDNAFQWPNLSVPVQNNGDLPDWFYRASLNPADPCIYSYRHLGTIYNMDRIIAPRIVQQRDVGGNIIPSIIKAVDVNAPAKFLYAAIREALFDAGVRADLISPWAAQMAVNIKDYQDPDSSVTVFDNPDDGFIYYGFDRPCIYLSELVYKEVTIDDEVVSSYGLELCRPYLEDKDPCDWEVTIYNDEYEKKGSVAIDEWSGSPHYEVIKWDPCNIMQVTWYDRNRLYPPDEAEGVPCDSILSWQVNPDASEYEVYLGDDSDTVENADSTSAVYKGTTVDNSYDPGGLDPCTTYFWRIDPLDNEGSVIDQGEIWSFETDVIGKAYFSQNAVTKGWTEGQKPFGDNWIIELRRKAGGDFCVVDSVRVPAWLNDVANDSRSYQRDNRLHKCIHRQWGRPDANEPTLGYSNIYQKVDLEDIQAHPYLAPQIYTTKTGVVKFKNIGEVGKSFYKSAYLEGPEWNRILPNQEPPYTPSEVLIDLTQPRFQQLFNWLTVLDPTRDLINNDGDERIDEVDLTVNGYPAPGSELKIPGRININTAPWFVLAQLPWVQTTPGNYSLAQAIVNYRNSVPFGFRSIGELMKVGELYPEMYHYRNDTDDQAGMPDLTPRDAATNDMEERDLIFQRISNLVTVRSDVFTAYILVRVGANGPQRRVIAILDRSDVYPDGFGGTYGKVRVKALYPVPDPR